MRCNPVWTLGLAALGLCSVACDRRVSELTVLPATVPASGEAPFEARDVAPGPHIRTDASPAPAMTAFRQLPFTHPPGHGARLAVYDRASHDVLWFPGAGVGVSGVSRLDDGLWACDDGRDVSVYDSHREERVVVVHGREVGGFAFQGTFATRETMYFLGQSDPALAERGIGWLYGKREPATSLGAATVSPRVSVPPGVSSALGQARWIAPVNALAARFGGLTSVSVDGQDSVVAFTTTTGRVFVYSPLTRKVTSRPNFPDELGDQHATQVTVDPVWGRFLVWHDTVRRTLIVFDRWQARLEPVPLTRFGMGVVSASAPGFHETDPDTISLTLTMADDSTRIVAYRLSDGRVEMLPVLDAFRTWGHPALTGPERSGEPRTGLP